MSTRGNDETILRESESQGVSIVGLVSEGSEPVSNDIPFEWQLIRFHDGMVSMDNVEQVIQIMKLNDLHEQLLSSNPRSPYRANLLKLYRTSLRERFEKMIEGEKHGELIRTCDRMSVKLSEVNERARKQISTIETRTEQQRHKERAFGENPQLSRARLLETAAGFGRRRLRVFKPSKFPRSITLEPIAAGNWKRIRNLLMNQGTEDSECVLDRKQMKRLQFLDQYITNMSPI